jgi:hypothetical protein
MSYLLEISALTLRGDYNLKVDLHRKIHIFAMNMNVVLKALRKITSDEDIASYKHLIRHKELKHCIFEYISLAQYLV